MASPYSKTEDAEWLRQRLAYESTPEAAVRFDPAPQRFHPVLRGLAGRLRAAAVNHANEVKRRDAHYAQRAKRSPSQKWAPNMEAMQWMNLDGGFLVDPRRRHALRVTWLTYQRALAIADALVRAAVQRGCSVELDRDEARIILNLDVGELSVSIRERQERGEKGPVPTDKLAIATEGLLSGLSDIVDAPDRPVQDRINEVFPRLYRTVVKTREWKRHWNAEAEEKARADAQKAAAAAALAEQQRIAAEAVARKAELLAEAARWHQAAQIRAYVAHLDACGATDAEWRAWALRAADEMDPAEGRLRMGGP